MTVSALPSLKPRKMTYAKWVDKFKPLKNHLHSNTQLDGLMFETYGTDLGFVQAANPNCVWTLVEGDTGKWYVVDGYHLVNRVGYLVTKEPYGDHAGGYSIFYM